MPDLPIDKIGEIFLLNTDLEKALAGKLRVDVLHVTGSLSWKWPLPRWFLEKTSRWTLALQKLGVTARALVPQAVLPGCSRDNLLDFLALVRPRVVISRSFCLRGRDLEALSRMCPGTVFLQSNHTPNSFMLQADDSSPLGWLESLESARTNPQVYLSSVSKFDSLALAPLAPDGKVLWVPNPCNETLVLPHPSGRNADVPTIALACRTNFQKNLKNQIDAIALVARRRPINLEVNLGHDVMPGMREALRHYIHQLLGGTARQVSITEFVTPAAYMERAASGFDVFLQVTFDESFGYLNWEMMAAGVPTLTTPNIQVPGSATVDPLRIDQIAAKIEEILDNPHPFRAASLENARAVAAENNAYFALGVKTLVKAQAALDGGP